MSKLSPTYVREDGEVFAFFEGHVIARDPIFAKAEKTALDYLDSLKTQRANTEKEKEKKEATHITTPNGMKGQILNRVDGLWGDEYTVRFANGRIAKLQTHAGDPNAPEFTKEQADSPEEETDELQAILDEEYAHDKTSLAKRILQLSELITTASLPARTASLKEDQLQRINQIILAANHEKAEIGEALAYLEDADREAFVPFQSNVVHQASLGRSKDDLTTSWFDRVAQDMIDESNGQNFEKILLEDPSLFVAGLETGTLAEQGSTAELSRSFIFAKTAGFQGAEVESYREKFVAAAELARRIELSARQESVAKQASVKETETIDAPDESLFL